MVELVCKATNVKIYVNEKEAEKLLARSFASRPCSSIPTEENTIAEIKAYADEHGISLDGLKKKSDMLEAIKKVS